MTDLLDDIIASHEIQVTPTSGPDLLHEVEGSIRRYVVLPTEDALVAVSLWCVATHAVAHFEHATRLCVHSPVKRCGKSRLLEVIGGIVHRPLATTNISVPALFRVIDKAEDKPPTLMLDEADRLLGNKRLDDDNADLIALLNNGFRRGSPTWRCVGPSQVPTEFQNFAFAAVAGIGRLPDTVEDRGINVTMRRRLPGEHVDKFRLRSDLPALEALSGRVAQWVADNGAEIERASNAPMPDELEDRQQDAWEPLIAVADVAGGEWPVRARTAAVRLSQAAEAEDSEQSIDTTLLRDVRTVFASMPDCNFESTARLITRLHQLEDAPWHDFDLTGRKLALRLGKFGVKPTHNTARTERGYRRNDLSDAFRRYLPSDPSESSDTAPEQGKQPDASETPDASNRPPEMNRPEETAGQKAYRTVGTLWTDTPPEAVPFDGPFDDEDDIEVID